jgi:uncharacterized protein (DUF1800 family)
LSDKKKKEIRRQSVEDLKNLNLAWMHEMIDSEAQLREKMSLFWHGHFACRVINIYYQQLLLHEIRTNALGNFGDLLRGISKSAAMLQFLNNQQNHVQHPNENFAREVMELFTMGRRNYTENDIKESARAFTGWGFQLNGQFVFRNFFHDKNSKTILGKTGNFDGDDVLNILLEQKATAQFITKKIYRFFVNDTVNDEHVEWLAARFYQSNYNIQALMDDIFTADWFYLPENIGTHIKSPVELLVGIRRAIPMQLQNEQIQILLQRTLGQMLFYPPNVAGWPGGKTWIDSSSLMLRLRIPQLIAQDETFSLKPKDDDDQQMGMMEKYYSNKNSSMQNAFAIHATIDWDNFFKRFENFPREKLYGALSSALLQTGAVPSNATAEMINTSSREEYIKTLTIALMSTPEYQLC